MREGERRCLATDYLTPAFLSLSPSFSSRALLLPPSPLFPIPDSLFIHVITRVLFYCSEATHTDTNTNTHLHSHTFTIVKDESQVILRCVCLFPPNFLLLLPLLSFLLSIPCRLRQGRRLACSCLDSDSNESYAKQGETVPSPILSLSEAILSLCPSVCQASGVPVCGRSLRMPEKYVNTNVSLSH